MIIIKIGGGATININAIVEDLKTLQEPFIIVHGANAVRNKLAEDLGSPRKVVTSISGYSSVLSDKKAIDILMMAYAGVQNKRIVELCQQNEINAVGLSGIDGKVVQGKRNVGIKVQEGSKRMLLRDFSGKPQSINTTLLDLLLENGYVPVLCVPIIDENNIAINSENDDIVRVLAQSMKATTIIQLIEEAGFLDDKDDPTSLVKTITKMELAQREAQVEGRMKRKMLALKKLFEAGASKVIISDGRTEYPIQNALSGKGTIIQ